MPTPDAPTLHPADLALVQALVRAALKCRASYTTNEDRAAMGAYADLAAARFCVVVEAALALQVVA